MRVLTAKEGRAAAAAILAHENNGHLSRELTFRSLQRTVTWTSIRVDVTRAILACKRCSQFGRILQNALLPDVYRYDTFDCIA
jgi:hypothetical protein